MLKMVETLILVIAAVICAVIVVLIWYLRFRTNKSVAERVRRSPQEYLGRVAAGVYSVHLPNSNQIYVGYATPPPTFSRAVKFPMPPPRSASPSPSIVVLDIIPPPPTYAQAIIFAQERGPKSGSGSKFRPTTMEKGDCLSGGNYI